MPPPRTYSAGKYMLRLEGADIGFVQDVEGGEAYAEAISVRMGGEAFAAKHLGPARYEAVTAGIGLGLEEAVYQWIAATFQADPDRTRSGALVRCDAQSRALDKLQFTDALLTEVTFPAFDGSSKGEGSLTLKFKSEQVRLAPGDGTKLAAPSGTRQKKWILSNFRLEIDGLDCSRVARIDSFTVRQNVTAAASGGGGTATPQPGEVDFPNIRVTLSVAGAETWFEWAEDFIVNGNNGDGQEKQGAVVILKPDMRTELARINLQNLGIMRLARQKFEAGASAMSRLTADLYCERMEFVLS